MDSHWYDLGQLQRWMREVITHPDGVEAGLRSEAAHAEIAAPAEAVEKIILPSRQQTSLQRLGIYANAYYARLLECLREEFPLLAKTLGEETFDGFAFGYLQAYPSRSYTLGDLGRYFPQYLTETQPADCVHDDGSPSWPDFVIDLAALERCYGEVFDGPGIENQCILQADDLGAIPPERWPEARLIPVPCLRLLTLRYPVHEYISAMRRDGEATVPDPQSTWLVVTRREYVVRRAAVSQTEFHLLSAIVAGETIGASVSRLASDPRFDQQTLEAKLSQWFQQWTAAAYFLGVQLAPVD
jgi:hypothetical protein